MQRVLPIFVGLVVFGLVTFGLLNADNLPPGAYLPIVIGSEDGPTRMPTSIFTSTPTATNTATDAPTNTPTSTPTATNTATPSPTPSLANCGSLPMIISSDTEMTSGCFYRTESENVLIEEGVTLSIPENVEIRFGGYMRVDGTLIAHGTEGKPVRFDGGGIEIRALSGNTSSLRDLIIESVTTSTSSVDGALRVVGAQPELDGITLQGIVGVSLNIGAAQGHTVTFRNGKFIGNKAKAILNERVIFENNYIEGTRSGNVTGAVTANGENIMIRNNTFYNNETVPLFLFGGSEESPIQVIGNVIEGNFGGAIKTGCTDNQDCNVLIQSNHIESNLGSGGFTTTPLIKVSCGNILQDNNFQDNLTNLIIEVRTFSGCDIDATNNWWGTDQAAEIDDLIYDYYDDFELGKVIYEPFSIEPN